MPKLTIDGREVEVAAGTSVLQACDQLGIEVPRFCYHDRLSVAGSCRMCLVEIEKMPKPVASCAMPCSDGMIVHTDTEAVRQERQGVLEMLLLNHPLDCPVCDQGGECDLQDLTFAYGRDRCRSTEKRRQVRDKELGPLIRTVMNRCIHCTRCIRFMNEIAGSPELGGLYRGEKMEISPSAAGALVSEMQGNLVDVCPVGALTSKPYAFRARPWELEKTDSIDVLDAVGSNIRVDSRGNDVMRIVPRLNEDVNEVWINDKTRFACDGLALQRLDKPWLRENGRLRPATWDEAIDAIVRKMKDISPHRIAALAGDLVDCESAFALRRLMHKIDSPHLDCRLDGAFYDPMARCGYIMNSTIAGIEKADAILLIGTDPRHEATLVNARIRKRWMQGGCPIGLIGAPVDLGYPYKHIGTSALAIQDVMDGRHPFFTFMHEAQNPLILLGAGALARPDGPAIHAAVRQMAEKLRVVRPDWNGFNVLQLAAGRVGALEVGFTPGNYGMNAHEIVRAAQTGELDVLYLLGADTIDTSRASRAFVIYQGHHGDAGAAWADVVLPGAAYTEKDAIYVNTEGRPQRAHRAVPPPGQAREDWVIIKMLSHALGKSLFFKTLEDLRAKMFEMHPRLGAVGQVSAAEWVDFGHKGSLSLDPLTTVIKNFYMTDPISRHSPTMARCVAEIVPQSPVVKEGGQ